MRAVPSIRPLVRLPLVTLALALFFGRTQEFDVRNRIASGYTELPDNVPALAWPLYDKLSTELGFFGPNGCEFTGSYAETLRRAKAQTKKDN